MTLAAKDEISGLLGAAGEDVLPILDDSSEPLDLDKLTAFLEADVNPGTEDDPWFCWKCRQPGLRVEVAFEGRTRQGTVVRQGTVLVSKSPTACDLQLDGENAMRGFSRQAKNRGFLPTWPWGSKGAPNPRTRRESQTPISETRDLAFG